MRLLDPDLVNWSVDGFGTHLRVKPEKDYLSLAKCFFGGDLW